MQIHTRRPRVLAVLGPTNTGKTHLALERMLAHKDGMIGFPLRLLARENYDRAVRLKGASRVALITGEEKIAPANARHFLCTVESMPLERPVAFLAVDEIQMCADPERGHVFTDRLLRARGGDETMFLGADTVRPLLRKLVPEAEVTSRPRFSTLVYGGPRKVTRLPPRSAVVAFSAAEVYALAELVRRQRGGAAVVLGALSPRARNAQVAMFQAGEVDYLVATDAIGMGLNLQIDHVAFAATRKFDGRAPRALSAAELAQIAGRAGRHMNDGTFGTTAEIGPLDAEIVERIENHRFDPLAAFLWRNPELDFSSLAALQAALARSPARGGLIRAREADDELALAQLARDPEVAGRARRAEPVRLLWDVCRIPDFRKILSDAHTRLLRRIFLHLASPGGRLPTDWVADQVARLDRPDGDIETLAQRIANIRTWTYVAYQGSWLADSVHWQERTRAVEDRLSDALHQRLTQRFVDRRAAVLVSRMRLRESLSAAVGAGGEVTVEGEPVGRLEGLRFVADDAGRDGAQRAIANAARRALRAEIARRVRTIEDDADGAFALDGEGRMLWRGAPVARLAAGPELLRPRIETLADDIAATAERERLRRRLSAWFEGERRRMLGPLVMALEATLAPVVRGLVFQLAESLGSMPRRRAEAQIAALGRADRKALGALGVRLGRECVFLPALLRPPAVALRARLWAAHHGQHGLVPPAPGRVSVPVAAPSAFYEAVGYRALGPRALRVDIVERLAARAFALSRGGRFAAAPELSSLAGCGGDEIAAILEALGYRASIKASSIGFERRRGGRPPAGRRRPRGRQGAPDSAFAKLRDLVPSE